VPSVGPAVCPSNTESKDEGVVLERRSCTCRCDISHDTGARSVRLIVCGLAGLCRNARRVLDWGVCEGLVSLDSA